MNINEIHSLLPEHCQLQAKTEVSDVMLLRGMHLSYVEESLKTRLAHAIFHEKKNIRIKRHETATVSRPDVTLFTTDVYVFSGNELEEFANRITATVRRTHEEDIQARVDSAVKKAVAAITQKVKKAIA